MAEQVELRDRGDARGCLPALAYFGDVPVEATYHGSALIYRLLSAYPEKLIIVERGFAESEKYRRLPGVRYEAVRLVAHRLLITRFNEFAEVWLSLSDGRHTSLFQRCLGDFLPDAVLTVAHGFCWIAAARYARQRDIPLHLIIHDDFIRRPRLWTDFLERTFSSVYQQAFSRLCISPAMAAEYKRRYGVAGSVLYPSRASDTPSFDSPPQERNSPRPFTVAFAGTVGSRDYHRQFRELSSVLSKIGGRLIVFGPSNPCVKGAANSIVFRGTLTSAELVLALRKEADLLFLPMPFLRETAEAYQLNFPSKLADYTATALPILIWGPSGSSAVQWAEREPTAAAVITDPNVCSIEAALFRLAGDQAWRRALGCEAARVGKNYFCSELARTRFHAVLRAQCPLNVTC
jgi:glycosyltransferase involved in cell wall biosynthesis